MANLFATKPLNLLMEEARETGEHSLKRTLGVFQLTALGVGAIIGAGIFVMVGLGAQYAGPGLTLSFVLSGLGCAFAGLCYAEFAAMIPLAGSAYTYAYATLGELFAWIIGWDLTLEYAMGASTVSSGWSTAGGCEVSDAAVRITVMPMPSSASISRRSRGITWSFGASRSSRLIRRRRWSISSRVRYARIRRRSRPPS